MDPSGRRFVAAARHVRSLPPSSPSAKYDPGNATKLRLYALYKSSDGDALLGSSGKAADADEAFLAQSVSSSTPPCKPNPSNRPGMFSPVERAKFDAWASTSADLKTKADAREAYVEELLGVSRRAIDAVADKAAAEEAFRSLQAAVDGALVGTKDDSLDDIDGAEDHHHDMDSVSSSGTATAATSAVATAAPRASAAIPIGAGAFEADDRESGPPPSKSSAVRHFAPETPSSPAAASRELPPTPAQVTGSGRTHAAVASSATTATALSSRHSGSIEADTVARISKLLTQLESRMESLEREARASDRAMIERLDSLQSRVERALSRWRSFMTRTWTLAAIFAFGAPLLLFLRRRRQQSLRS